MAIKFTWTVVIKKSTIFEWIDGKKREGGTVKRVVVVVRGEWMEE